MNKWIFMLLIFPAIFSVENCLASNRSNQEYEQIPTITGEISDNGVNFERINENIQKHKIPQIEKSILENAEYEKFRYKECRKDHFNYFKKGFGFIRTNDYEENEDLLLQRLKRVLNADTQTIRQVYRREQSRAKEDYISHYYNQNTIQGIESLLQKSQVNHNSDKYFVEDLELLGSISGFVHSVLGTLQMDLENCQQKSAELFDRLNIILGALEGEKKFNKSVLAVLGELSPKYFYITRLNQRNKTLDEIIALVKEAIAFGVKSLHYKNEEEFIKYCQSRRESENLNFDSAASQDNTISIIRDAIYNVCYKDWRDNVGKLIKAKREYDDKLYKDTDVYLYTDDNFLRIIDCIAPIRMKYENFKELINSRTDRYGAFLPVLLNLLVRNKIDSKVMTELLKERNELNCLISNYDLDREKIEDMLRKYTSKVKENEARLKGEENSRLENDLKSENELADIEINRYDQMIHGDNEAFMSFILPFKNFIDELVEDFMENDTPARLEIPDYLRCNRNSLNKIQDNQIIVFDTVASNVVRESWRNNKTTVVLHNFNKNDREDCIDAFEKIPNFLSRCELKAIPGCFAYPIFGNVLDKYYLVAIAEVDVSSANPKYKEYKRYLEAIKDANASRDKFKFFVLIPLTIENDSLFQRSVNLAHNAINFLRNLFSNTENTASQPEIEAIMRTYGELREVLQALGEQSNAAQTNAISTVRDVFNVVFSRERIQSSISAAQDATSTTKNLREIMILRARRAELERKLRNMLLNLGRRGVDTAS